MGKRQLVDRAKLLEGLYLQKQGAEVEVVDQEVLKNKYVAIFFYCMRSSACQEIAFKLRKAYLRLNMSGQPFEVVLVATDPSETEQSLLMDFKNNHAWVAIPFQERTRAKALRKAFKVSSVPKILMISPDGEVLTRQVVRSLMLDPEGEDFPWSEPLQAACCCI